MKNYFKAISKLNTKSFSQLNKVVLKAKNINSYMTFLNSVHNNLKINSSSQIFYNDSNNELFGELGIDKMIKEDFDFAKAKIQSLIENNYLENEVEFRVLNEKNNEVVSTQSKKRYSLLNLDRQVASIISLNLFEKNYDGDYTKKEKFDNVGYIVDKLEENKDFYDIIEIQGIPYGTKISENEELRNLQPFLRVLRRNQLLNDKLIIVRTAQVMILINKFRAK